MNLSPINGYVVRTRGLVAAQIAAGAEPRVVLPPLGPTSDGGEAAEPPFAGRLDRVEHPAAAGEQAYGVGDRLAAALYRLRSAGRRAGAEGDASGGATDRSPRRAATLARPLFDLEDRLLMRRLRRGLMALAKERRPDVIHSHSPYRSALPAIAAGRSLGVPAIYEVRGLWEESAVSEGLWLRGSRPYRAWRRNENVAMRQADAVITIGESLRRELVSRGAPSDRTFVVPNAVGEELLLAGGAAPAWRSGSPLTCIFGYVGSLRPLEGVEHLLRGVAACRQRGRDARALIVGGGPDRPRLEQLAADLGLGDSATFAGRLPHGGIAAAYRGIDVFAITRADQEVCRLVPPLKPLEAMAMGLPVVASNLPALRELVSPGDSGLLLPPEDPEAFATTVEPLYDPAFRRRCGARGRRWVLAERTWPAVLSSLWTAYLAAGLAGRRQADGTTARSL